MFFGKKASGSWKKDVKGCHRSPKKGGSERSCNESSKDLRTQNEDQCVAVTDNKLVPNLSATPNSPQRDEWMLGDFDSLLKTGSGANGVSRRSSSKTKPDPDAVKIINDRELNPYYANGGSGLPSSEVSNSATPSEPRGEGRPAVTGLVGDGGRSWRRRAEHRQREVSPPATLCARDLGGFREKWETARHWKRRTVDTPSGSSVDEQYSATADKPGGSRARYSFVSQSREMSRSSLSSTIPSASDASSASEASSAPIPQPISDQDANTMASQALKRMLLDRKVNVQSKPSLPAASGVRVLEDVDAQGRYLPALERLESQRQSPARDHRKLENEAPRATLDSLHREVRIKGVENYDHHLRELIMKKHYSADHEYDELIVNPSSSTPSREKRRAKMDVERFRRSRIRDSNALHQIESKCLFCPSNSTFGRARKDTLIAQSPHAYLCYQSFQQCVVLYHFFIAPIVHVSSSPALEEDTYQEIRNFQKSLISCLDAQHMGVIFVECMTRSVSAEKAMIGGGNHLVIDCFGLPLDRFNEAKAYFKKALLDTEGDWTHHKKVVPVVNRRDGCRSAVPRNFPYFYVDFGLSGGLLHIIEDERFPRTMGRDVIQGMMELDATETHFPSKPDYYSAVNRFKTLFSPYNWTAVLS